MNAHLRKAVLDRIYHPFAAKNMAFHLHKWDATRPDGKGGLLELGKVPYYSWTERRFNQLRVLLHAVKHGHNVGLRLLRTLLVLDIDQRHGGDESFEWLCAELDLDPSVWAGQATGSGGRHYILRKPSDVPICKVLKAYPGIDFLTFGSYIVGPGSIHPKTGKPYVWWPGRKLHDCPPRLLETLRKSEEASGNGTPTEPGRVDAEQLAAMLEVLDPAECAKTNEAWLAMAMDCHFLTNGSLYARDVFLAWCRLDPEYDSREFEEKNRRR